MGHLILLNNTMSIIRTLTQAEANQAAKEALIMQAGQATHHLAITLTSTNTAFWATSTEQLLETLNADIPTTLATFALNSSLGAAVNSSLDALNVPAFSTRAPVTAGRSDIVFDGTAFVYVAPPVPPPEPPPAQEP
jgi:hypothetical protein